jgi:hypothetical protein
MNVRPAAFRRRPRLYRSAAVVSSALNANEGIAVLVADLDAQQLSAEGLHGV